MMINMVIFLMNAVVVMFLELIVTSQWIYV